ncbi:sugar phosphate isomerase/epimerase family protein [Thermosediminibacter litoriperuensis]|uniref:Sugar phosphate isomerase/epimerase n=1 Tax=Thermosediminibacter litoriperuensis TaxID=291989 RepID=A0A5S5ADI3_9FIRM|nr:sugar phosphate isomerase/epimerase family protein [Thermosediminibacter litoriperuensis]TYP47890.1 sugar phosphate isomerase/epimerase [Thermosediminibacter litoriperuensis]
MKFSLTIAKDVSETFPVLLRGDYAENIKKASQLGYDCVEIHVRDPLELNLDEILSACEKNHVTVSTLGTGLGYVIDRLSFTNPDREIRERAVARIIDHINAARELGAKVIIGSMRGSIPDKSEYKKYEAFALECFEKCLSQAEDKGVTLLVEAINRYETNFINIVEEALEFIEKIGSSHLQVHIDTFHMNIEEVGMAKSIKTAGSLLGHVHFADSNRRYPGMGHINFKEIIKALKDTGYNGAIAFECLPYPNGEEAAKGAIENIKAIFMISM